MGWDWWESSLFSHGGRKEARGCSLLFDSISWAQQLSKRYKPSGYSLGRTARYIIIIIILPLSAFFALHTTSPP
jgi:hypothetical protein